jgi:uncharacterized membrane protein YhaH (DUF805 family)
VGFVSNTVLVHVVQVLPLVAIAMTLRRLADWSAVMAAPLFAFWFLIMAGIWLLLFGTSRFFTGSFTTTEILLTVIIGIACIVGLTRAYQQGTPKATAGRVLTVGVIAARQAAAVWLSYHPAVVAR